MHSQTIRTAVSFVLVSLLIVSVAHEEGWSSQGTATNNNATANVTKGVSTRKRRVGQNVNKSNTAKTAAARCDPDKQEAADLSGTYKGIVNYPDGGLNGEATLTITGNQFLLAIGNAAQTGRITAVTTCTYTAVSMMFGESRKAESGQPAPPPLPVVSVRAIKKGSDITLTTASGERRAFTFTPQKR